MNKNREYRNYIIAANFDYGRTKWAKKYVLHYHDKEEHCTIKTGMTCKTINEGREMIDEHYKQYE